jgi:crotonobetainyl-CoA:carnitine CoA-transferase CaiB-like acyl-CoA transferase
MRSPLRLSGTTPLLRRGPFLGEHSEEVLREICGYDAERIERLLTSGVVVSHEGTEG